MHHFPKEKRVPVSKVTLNQFRFQIEKTSSKANSLELQNLSYLSFQRKTN